MGFPWVAVTSAVKNTGRLSPKPKGRWYHEAENSGDAGVWAGGKSAETAGAMGAMRSGDFMRDGLGLEDFAVEILAEQAAG